MLSHHTYTRTQLVFAKSLTIYHTNSRFCTNSLMRGVGALSTPTASLVLSKFVRKTSCMGKNASLRSIRDEASRKIQLGCRGELQSYQGKSEFNSLLSIHSSRESLRVCSVLPKSNRKKKLSHASPAASLLIFSSRDFPSL